MDAQALSGGFDNTPFQSAIAFRTIMNVMARPGKIETLIGAAPNNELSVAAGVLLLTLCDPETPVYLAGKHDCAAVRDWLRFHTGSPLVDARNATFAVGTWEALSPVTQYSVGTPQYPDRSTSLVVEMASLSASGTVLTGPGIEKEARLNLPAIKPFQLNAALFPLGNDFFFTAGDQITALARTTKIGMS